MSHVCERPPATVTRHGPDGVCSLLASENSQNCKPTPRHVQDAIAALERDYEIEIQFFLAAKGWRRAALFLIRASDDLDLGDYLGAERNRQLAREQFIEGNAAFRRLPAATEAIANAILAGGSPMSARPPHLRLVPKPPPPERLAVRG